MANRSIIDDLPVKQQNVAPVPRLGLSIVEAARCIGLSERAMRDLISLKQIRVRHCGRRVIVPVTALQEFLDADAPAEGKRP